ALIPRWAQVGGQDSLDRRLADPGVRARIRAEMVQNLERRGGANAIMFARYGRDAAIEGRTLAQVAAERATQPIDTAIELIRGGGPSIISFNMHASDVKVLMQQPWTMTSSDGDLVPMGHGVPHPRAYGTFPRRIQKYVFEEGTTDLAHAIRSMTSL